MVEPMSESVMLPADIRLSNNLGLSVARHDQCQSEQVEDAEDVLGQPNVSSLIRPAVQDTVDIDVRCRIDQGPSVASDLGIVSLASNVLGDLLYIGSPIDFRVCQTCEEVSCVEDMHIFVDHLHGTLQMIRPQRTTSANSNSGQTHRVCRGSWAIRWTCRTTSIGDSRQTPKSSKYNSVYTDYCR